MKRISQTVLEWQAEARAEERVDNRVESILRLLNLRFPGTVPADVVDGVRAVRDLEKLDRWFDVAVTTPTVEDFRRAMSNGGT